MSKQDLFRSYGPGKFDNHATELLYEMSLDGGADEECGNDNSGDWFGLMRGPFDHPQLKKYKGAILQNTDQGFVYSDFFTSKIALDKKWKKICNELENISED